MPDLFYRVNALQMAGKFRAAEAESLRSKLTYVQEACNTAEQATIPEPKIKPAHLSLVADQAASQGGMDSGRYLPAARAFKGA